MCPITFLFAHSCGTLQRADPFISFADVATVLTLDVMDVAGEHQSDISHSVFKVQLSPDGSEIRRERSPSKSITAVKS